MKDTSPNLAEFDFIVINTSAGKDSQAMMGHVVRLAEVAGVKDRVIAVHCDLGQVEWEGTCALAKEHCAHYGIPLNIVKRSSGDLLQQIEERGMFPDNGNRYCTSDQKRDQVAKLLTAVVRDFGGTEQVKILNCMGLRAEESHARAKKSALETNKRQTNGKRLVIDWLPLHTWTTAQVWETIKASGVRYHHAYDLGMPRLSCMFCIFAPFDALVIAGRANPALLDKYATLEAKIGHTFRHNFKIASVKEAIANGYQPATVKSWTM